MCAAQFCAIGALFRAARFIDNRAQMWYYSDDDMFSIALTNVLITLCYIIPGFALCKLKKACADHLSTLSAVLVYVCSPCMIASSMLEFPRSARAMADVALFFAVFLLLQLAFMLILFALCRKRYGEAKYRIFTVASVMGNVGFFGLPVVTALFPSEPLVGCYSSAYLIGMNLLVFTIGVYAIRRDPSYISLRAAVLNPTTLSTLVALPLYLLKIRLPESLNGALSLLGKTTTPLCMIVLGMRLASVELKRLFSRPFVYGVCAMKLIVYPLVAYGIVLLIPGLDETFRDCMLVLSAAPSAAVILSLAELHRCEQELSANVVLLTTLASIVTLPLLSLLIA